MQSAHGPVGKCKVLLVLPSVVQLASNHSFMNTRITAFTQCLWRLLSIPTVTRMVLSPPPGTPSVSDANSHIIGMHTSDASQTDSTDITYVSPYYFLNEHIKKAFSNSYLYLIPNLTLA